MFRSINYLTGLARQLNTRPVVLMSIGGKLHNHTIATTINSATTTINILPSTTANLTFRPLSSTAQDANNETHKKIHTMIQDSQKNVFVFMKGVPEAPACGYSDAVCKILNAYDVKFDSYNVLTDDEVRQGIKAYSEWPTIPQVYIKGQFVGGCDTLLQMHQSGELEQMLSQSSNHTDHPNNNNSKG